MKLFAKKHPRRTPPPPAANPLLHAPHVVQRCQGGSGTAGTTHLLPGHSGNAVVALALVDTPKGPRLLHIDSKQQVRALCAQRASHLSIFLGLLLTARSQCLHHGLANARA